MSAEPVTWTEWSDCVLDDGVEEVVSTVHRRGSVSFHTSAAGVEELHQLAADLLGAGCDPRANYFRRQREGAERRRHEVESAGGAS